MNEIPKKDFIRPRPARKLLVTLVISAPIAFWMIWLFS